jgi:hypothetical protein
MVENKDDAGMMLGWRWNDAGNDTGCAGVRVCWCAGVCVRGGTRNDDENDGIRAMMMKMMVTHAQ